MKAPLLRSAVVIALALGALNVGACSPRVDTRGNAIHIEDVAEIKPGEHTRQHVLSKLGSPSAQTAFGDDAWYYISEKTETTAFLAPKLIERQVVVVKFDPHGVVTSVDVVDEQSAENIEPIDRETPTAGNSLGLVEQLLSNVGRFNRDK